MTKAAAQLGYSPNQSGRSLRQGMTGMVALLIPTNDKLEFTGTIFTRVLEGLRTFVRNRDRDVMVHRMQRAHTADEFVVDIGDDVVVHVEGVHAV